MNCARAPVVSLPPFPRRGFKPPGFEHVTGSAGARGVSGGKFKRQFSTMPARLSRLQQDRLERAASQDICILTDCLPWSGPWSGQAATRWQVLGTQGVAYRITMDMRGELLCDCVDGLRNRGQLLCKHACFVMMHAFEVEDLDACIASRRVPADAIDRARAPRERVERRNQSCSICFGGFEDAVCVLACAKCLQGFHEQCISTWLRQSSTCPMCRQGVVAARSLAHCV